MINNDLIYKFLLRNIDTADIPIIIYKMVHIGANTQRGGLKTGLCKLLYQEKSLIFTAKPDT